MGKGGISLIIVWSFSPSLLVDTNYGRKSAACESVVKEIYAALDMPAIYRAYEEESYTRVSALIEAVDENVLPRKMFYDFMNRIYKRTK